MLTRSLSITLLVCFLVVVGAACQPSGAFAPAPPTSTSEPAIREALIDGIDVQISESVPAQINVIARGHLTEACAQLSDVKQRYEPPEFQITIFSASPIDRGCAQVTTPFEKVIPLDVADLSAGAYAVVVNGVRGSFQLTTDNLPPAASTVTPNASPIPAARPIKINSLADLRSISQEIVAAEPAAAQARADQLWQTLVKGQRVPLIFDQTVVFLYKGQADRVNWRGDFNAWAAPGLEGQRIGQSDLWIGVAALPPASRADYKIVINDKDWLADRANPHTTFSGLTGVNSVVTMPGFKVTDESQKRNDVTPGKLTGESSITSTQLGYAVDYWVYTPRGYENLQQLPVLYVLDGNDFVDERMGAMPTILDNLIADKRIEPIIAVFIDARDPNNPQFNRREEEFLAHPIAHAGFIADELVPLIDRTYRTNAQADARVIAGVSYGGLSSSFIAASRSNVFHNIAAFSPAFWPLGNPQALANQGQRAGSILMAPTIAAVMQCGGDTGFTCPRFPLKIFMSGGLPDWDQGDFAPTIEMLQQHGYPVDFHQVQEGHGWDNWRGLTDEMLIYFFGSH